METRTIQSIIVGLTKLVESKTPVSPDLWMDSALWLQTLKFREQEKRLALEIIANKRKKELREKTESNVDAEIEWKCTQEYEDWRRQEELMKDIVLFTQVAKKQAEILKNY